MGLAIVEIKPLQLHPSILASRFHFTLLQTHSTRPQQGFLDMTGIMEGQSFNVLAALKLANATALENRDRFAYFRMWSDEYVGVRTTGIQVGGGFLEYVYSVWCSGKRS